MSAYDTPARLAGGDRGAPRAAAICQGVSMVTADPVRVVDVLMNDVPPRRDTMGEIVMRGNTAMTGFFRDPEGTAEAFTGGRGGSFPDGGCEAMVQVPCVM